MGWKGGESSTPCTIVVPAASPDCDAASCSMLSPLVAVWMWWGRCRGALRCRKAQYNNPQSSLEKENCEEKLSEKY